jgi:MerR family transcriptional regulator/heat shock protein HspR
MLVEDNMPVYPIGVAAKILDVHPRTLRIYEDEGLVKVSRQSGKRLYSNNDIKWIRCLRHLIHSDGISIPALKMLLDMIPCWKIRDCPEEIHTKCEAYVDNTKCCWELADIVCAKSGKNCKTCEVYQKKQPAKK